MLAIRCAQDKVITKVDFKDYQPNQHQSKKRNNLYKADKFEGYA